MSNEKSNGAAVGSTELLGCPFCGGDAEIERKGSARASMVIACTMCQCRLESGDVYGLTNPKDWVWNSRQPNAKVEFSERSEASER